MTSKNDKALLSKAKALTSNHARNVYDKSFDIFRREAKKQNMDLSLFLSSIMSNVSHDIKLPNTLKNKKKERELWLKERYRGYFFEWVFNTTHLKLSLKDIKGLVGHTKGGKNRGEKKTLERIEREEIIKQKARELDVKKLLADGMKKKDIDKLVADSIPAEKKKKEAGIQYVRKFLKSRNYDL